MDLKDAFWGLVLEAGSSPEEFAKLEISVSFSKERASVNMYKVSTDVSDKTSSAPPPSGGDYEYQVLFDNVDINLHDPESLDQIKSFIQKVKSPLYNLINYPTELGANPRGLGNIDGQSLDDRAKAKFGWHWRVIEPDND